MVRMPFAGPPKEEVVAVATDLIARFGLQAHDEALHLEQVAAMLRSVRNRALYRDVAREIEKSMTEARVRLKATPEFRRRGTEIVGAWTLLAREASAGNGDMPGDQDRAGMGY